MENWVGSPLIVVAGLAAASALTSIGIWVGKVNSDRSAFIEFMQEIRNDIKEIRASINAIYELRLRKVEIGLDDPHARADTPCEIGSAAHASLTSITINKCFARDRATYRFTRSLASSLTGVSMVTMASASSPLKRCQEAISTPLSSPHSSKLFVAGIAPNWAGQSSRLNPGASTAICEKRSPPRLGMHRFLTRRPASLNASASVRTRTTSGSSPTGAPSRERVCCPTSEAQCSAMRTVFRQFSGSS